MLKEEVFEDLATKFGTSIGVATIYKIQPLEECKSEFETSKDYKEYEEELTINNIICKAIDLGRYQLLQRVLYKMELEKDKRLKELTIYRRAWKEVVNNVNLEDLDDNE